MKNVFLLNGESYTKNNTLQGIRFVFFILVHSVHALALLW